MAPDNQQPSSLEPSRFNDGIVEGRRGHAQECASLMTALLQHPMFCTDQHLFCSIPSISKAWRAAARIANTRCLEASVSTAEGMRGIHSFSRWLPRYCSIPCSIHIWGGTSGDVNVESADSVLSLCLQLAAANAREEGSSMQLHTYCSDVFIGRYVLQSLPQDTLTSLEFAHITSGSMPDLSIGLQHLRNLRSLQLLGLASGEGALVVDVCMPAIGQLTRLTNLLLGCVASFSYEQLPAQQLQRLVVAYSDSNPMKVVAAFSHLTRLSYVSLDIADEDTELGPLPVQLAEVKLSLGHGLSTSDTSLNLSAVTHLQRVSFGFSYETAGCLLALRTLPNLQHVDIHSNDMDSLTEASLTWPRLPQLHSVCFHDAAFKVFVASFKQLMRNISGTTSLTRLMLEDIEIYGPGLLPPFCAGLANLSSLQELSLQFIDVHETVFVAHDVQKLSALTQLTWLHLKPADRLYIKPADRFVMDDDVVVLALHLQRLQKLCVPVRSVPVLAAICHGGSKDLQEVGVYIASTLDQDPAWQRYVDESHFHVVVC